MALRAVVGHHVTRKLKVAINHNKRRKFIKIKVTDELSEDEFEEIYQEFAFGKYELRDVYVTFNAAMEIGTPNVFRVVVEDAVCKIVIAKEKDMELPPFVLRPISGPAVQKYQEIKQKQRRQKKGKSVESDKEESEDDAADHDEDDDVKQNENEEDVEEEKPNVFVNKLPLAQPSPLK